MTVLTTPRLTLRKPRVTDLLALHDIMQRPEVMRYWARPEHDQISETAAYLTRMIEGEAKGADDFVIVLGDQIIGKAGMWRQWEVGFLLHPDHWGKGLAHEAMRAVIAHLFATHATDHLTAEADPRNAASLGLLARLGFHETHRAENTLQWRDEWCDSVYLRLDRRE